MLLKKPNNVSIFYQFGTEKPDYLEDKYMIVMLTQDLSKGFVSWKEMYFENKDALEA